MNSLINQIDQALTYMLDLAARILGGLLSLILLPFAAIARAIRWLRNDGRYADMDSAYAHTNKQMSSEARRSTAFLRTYMREYQRIVDNFRQGNYQTLQEAQVAYSLFKLAEANLLTRAYAEAGIANQQATSSTVHSVSNPQEVNAR